MCVLNALTVLHLIQSSGSEFQLFKIKNRDEIIEIWNSDELTGIATVDRRRQ